MDESVTTCNSGTGNSSNSILLQHLEPLSSPPELDNLCSRLAQGSAATAAATTAAPAAAAAAAADGDENVTGSRAGGIKRRRSAETDEEEDSTCPSPALSTSSSAATSSSSPSSSSLLLSSECLMNFSELYLPPPTPRMISSLDGEYSEEDESGSATAGAVVVVAGKRHKVTGSGSDVTSLHAKNSSGGGGVGSCNRPALRPCNSLTSSSTSASSSSSCAGASITTTSSLHSSSGSSCSSNQNSSPLVSGGSGGITSGLSLVHSTSGSVQQPTAATTSVTSYSCGQSSLFGELQSVVFHSLITSLES